MFILHRRTVVSLFIYLIVDIMIFIDFPIHLSSCEYNDIYFSLQGRPIILEYFDIPSTITMVINPLFLNKTQYLQRATADIVF